MTKDEMITEITGLLPFPDIKCSLKAVRIARDIYDLFEKNYTPPTKIKINISEMKPEIDKSLIRL